MIHFIHIFFDICEFSFLCSISPLPPPINLQDPHCAFNTLRIKIAIKPLVLRVLRFQSVSSSVFTPPLPTFALPLKTTGGGGLNSGLTLINILIFKTCIILRITMFPAHVIHVPTHNLRHHIFVNNYLRHVEFLNNDLRHFEFVNNKIRHVEFVNNDLRHVRFVNNYIYHV